MTIPKLNYNFSKQYGVLTKYIGRQLTILHKQDLSVQTLLELQRFFKEGFELEKISPQDFQTLLTKTYETGSEVAQQMAEDLREDTDLLGLLQELPKQQDLLDNNDDAPIIRLLNALFSEALKLGASDIHIETFEENLMIRFRIDGVLREMIKPQRILAPLVVSRIKVMAKLDIAEKRLPQDGRISLHLAGRSVDVRVSTLPTSHGERVVLRLLDRQNVSLNLNSLGMSPKDRHILEALIAKPHGIILVTGPTGSGKTTTLYAALTQLNEVSRNILTVEDPIEYDLVGIGQMQVNMKVDMTFAKGLRAILRQDPDVVMVGEIRDLETADIAIQASLTGHLVLSTLHTNSAVGAITRLQDMGVESFLLASSLVGVVAQRLVRVLCTQCKKDKDLDESSAKFLGLTVGFQEQKIYDAVGCEACGFSGYAGRMGIYEMLPIDEKLKVFIHEKESEQSIEQYARTRFQSIQQDGIHKILQGLTTIEEVLRVTSVEI